MLRTEGSQERLDNLAELKQSVYEYETTCGEECTLEHYLAHVALFTNADAGDSSDRVKLMTVHTAKGLEFPHVFLCAMNEGLFPSKKIRTLPAMEEERRLAFVAMTRAEQGLYLSEAAGRNFDGTDRYPSRFLLDIAPGLLEQSGERDDMLLDNARSYIAISERTLRGSADAALAAVPEGASACGTAFSARAPCWSSTRQSRPGSSALTDCRPRGAFLSARGSRRARSRKETPHHDPTGIFCEKSARCHRIFRRRGFVVSAVCCGAVRRGCARLLRQDGVPAAV